ncbi:NADPH:quinone reductase [Sphaerisporangium siamense]|uniref:NADPH:quinone reductase-like Zn-dependent oxidoreductase n=1 Tax=Sphaerisporangium siamense TaxID=795645 RepID=A0A7W7GCD2_9ACTN|nr:NADP-dependent oxidoreductase [Sphaerisporangium siamense]MBB4703750.1 NADPH:quinone reductase-like Zn-dependent oxidoreductase [Sphaerisporangium siamense]GII82218.1 NADPH:quinone reductase [Sphaerisporangium siamense]
MPKAYVFTRYGGPETESLTELTRPVPGPGELLVAVRAAGVNPVDWKRRAGYLAAFAPVEFPAVIGSEAAGVVAEAGEGVEGFAPGDAVFGNPLTGGYAEYTLLPAETTARKPEAVSFADAATLPVAAATAYDGLHQLGLPPGATLLITGVGGGVGVAAAQIARHAGLTVVGTASVAKKEFVESLGVTYVEPGPGLAERVRAAAPGGVQAVYDLVGGAALEEAAEALDDRSKLITAADRETVARLGGSPVERARTREVLEEVAALVERGVLRPFVTATYPLGEASRALRVVEEGHAQGKIVIEVPGE